jgi:hypothetical protein
MALNGFTQTWHDDMHANLCVCVCVCDITKVTLTIRFFLEQLLIKSVYSFQHPSYVCSASCGSVIITLYFNCEDTIMIVTWIL